MMSRDSDEYALTCTKKVDRGPRIDPPGAVSGRSVPSGGASRRQRRRMTLPVTSDAASEAR